MTTTVTAVNQTQSLAAIRNFVRAAVSCITYARGLCSDNAYEQRPFLGLPLRQLIPSTAESITISEWIEKGAFDALNRSYLKEMSLCVHDGDCQALLESYCFSFNYTADGQRAQMSLSASQNAEAGGPVRGVPHVDDKVASNTTTALRVPAYRSRRCSKQEVQRTLTHILERLLDVVGCLPPLLSKRVLTMRLTYYDDVTPSSYEPPCFAPASHRMQQLYQEEVKWHVHIGAMDTSHHFFSVAIRHPLLQKMQSQMTQQRLRASGYEKSHEEGGDVGLSSPLRSRLESTFSSAAMLQQPTAGVQPSAAVAASPKSRSVLSKTAALHSESSSHDEGAAVQEGDDRDAGAVEDVTSHELATIEHLVEKGDASSLRQREVEYLLLASFVFTHAPSVRGGRGRLTIGDIDTYRAQSCPMDLSAEATQRMLYQLCSEGHLSPCHAIKGGRLRKAASPLVAHDAFLCPSEWAVPDPPLFLLQRLLQIHVLTQLLPPPCHAALEELCVYLDRERARGTDCIAFSETPPLRKRKRGLN